MKPGSFQKGAKAAQKSEGCGMGALVRKKPRLCSEIVEGKAQMPRKDTGTKFD